MEIAILVIPIAIIVGYIRGGTIAGFEKEKFSLLWLVFVAFFLRFLVNFPELPKSLGQTFLINFYPLLNILAFLFLIIFTVLNIKKVGMPVLFLGTFLNFIPIVLNGGKMPFELWAAKSTRSTQAILNGAKMGIPLTPSNHSATFWQLGDWIVVPGIRMDKLISIGDIFILLGLFIVIEEIVARHKRK